MQLLIVAITICFIFYLMVKRFADQRKRIENEQQFEQAGVKVSYCNGTIAIDKEVYDVKQVTGIQLTPYQSALEVQQDTDKNVVIELDDTIKPKHKIRFVSRGQAETFALKLIRALKIAGNPKMI